MIDVIRASRLCDRQVGMKHIVSDILSNPQFIEGSAWKRRVYKAGEKIIEKGELGSSLFFVESGMVRVLGGAELDGDIRITPGLCDLGVGALFGDGCLYLGDSE